MPTAWIHPTDVMDFAMNLPMPVFRGSADIYFTNSGDLRAAPDGRVPPVTGDDYDRRATCSRGRMACSVTVVSAEHDVAQ